MPAHPKAYQRLFAQVAQANDSSSRDQWLDEILDVQQRATEWDADQWGFNSDLWMAAERAELAERGGNDWSQEHV